MTFVKDLESDPTRFDMFALLRRLERSFPDRPRIGNSETLREDYVRLGENPYLEFPASNVGVVRRDSEERFHVFVKFLGMLGPQGPLPLATTEEAFAWWLANDDAFPRFLDLFNNRFIQLFFRAWADSKPIAHHDRPNSDRFADYVGSIIGIGTEPYKNLDKVPDIGKLGFAGLIAPRTKSASRLAGMIAGLFDVKVEIEEFVGSWLSLEPAERSMIGRTYATLGTDTVLGASVYSIQDKVRIRILVDDLGQYRSFLPIGTLCEPLNDAVFFYVGAALDWEVELAIPAKAIEAVRLGKSGELGWTSWMSPNWSSNEAIRADARFNPAERLRARHAAAS